MTQGRGDGRNPRFRLLCKKCNSYVYTMMKTLLIDDGRGVFEPRTVITCLKCNNTAADINEEFE